MKTAIQNEKYGAIVYDENFWTGQKTITIDGVTLGKKAKNVFEYYQPNGELALVNIKGSLLSGVKLTIGADEIQLLAPPKWYEVVFAVLSFMLVLIWGNVPALCEIIPIVGGALGGFLAALCVLVGFSLSRKTENTVLKLLISIGMLVATFLICFLAAILVLSVLA